MRRRAMSAGAASLCSSTCEPSRYDRRVMSHSVTWPPQPVATAGFAIRTVAYLVDAVVLSVLGGAFQYLVTSPPASQAGNAGQQVATSTSGSVLVSLVYFVILWSRLGGGRTLGMRLLGLKVIQ